jgi:hypothetical protein
MMSFTYMGKDDEFENGRVIEYSFNAHDANLDAVLEHFRTFLLANQYSPELVNKINYSD